ncbi:adaptin N terminal region-domain-containing protein [Phlyctochytrium arcticum]|nr:adaptin N terminal region-domain-containing protein [Phlyctochytrium arcticum]
MRGLTVFIADLRNCRARELEEKRVNKELANIRSKFKDPSLSGRQKKKYVCKLLYMYILGWDVDFGHMEAVNLLSSSKYSEKQIGYLAVTLMLTESNELLRLVVNSMRKDLDDPVETTQCLALQAIANIGAREMAEALANDVLRLLTTSHTKSFVKKKAALCLLRLYRRHPDLIPAKEWVVKVLGLMEDRDMAVALCATSLVLAIAQQYPEESAGAIDRAVSRIHKILNEKEYGPDYVYYKVPVPWLQVKLLRLLQYFPPPEDRNVRQKLIGSLQTILTNAQDIPKNVQHNNAQNAVLFEAINLAIHVDPDSDIVVQASALLGRFISSKETNIRYLGLETMSHLAGVSSSLGAVQRHQETIIQSLKDKDISVRRRALDLLYSMCDISNAKTIVTELLQYLTIADFAIREEMVLKIAILTEKFATDYSWYVDVILQLITVAGDNVSDGIWYRVVQIVTNNEDLQEYAARTVLAALKSPTCHETTLKVGGYILGEFGHLIANLPGCAPMEQFMSLHSKFGMCTTSTRSMLLSTYLKFCNIFPEIKEHVIRVLKQYRFVLDVELQQRACEYLAIVTLPTDDILQAACEEMPPFPQRESALLSKLQKKTEDTEDKRTWQIGGKDANNAPTAKRNDRRRSTVTAERPSQTQSASSYNNANPHSDMDDLLGLREPVAAQANPMEKYNKLVLEPNGVIYEDQYIQIGLKTEYQQQQGRLAIFFGNKSTATISNLQTDLQSGGAVKITLTQPIASTIPPATQYNQVYQVECLDAAGFPVTMNANFQIGNAPVQLNIIMPIVLSKFVTPVELGGPDFFSRWKQIGGPPREGQAIGKYGNRSTEAIKNLIKALNIGVLEGIDPNPNNLVGAGIFNASNLGKIGCLMRLELNVEQQMFRVTLRTTNETVSEVLTQQIKAAIKAP